MSEWTLIDEVAAGTPTPGGGAAAAYVGALGSALNSMVGNLTVGKKSYVDVEDQVKECLSQLQRVREELLALSEKDFKFVMVDNMEWFNVFGLIFIAVIMIPNVVFAIKCKDGFDNKWNNKYVEVTEQVGRLGCFGFMIINIPGTWFGWWSDEAFALYLIVDTILVMLYCAIWIICFKKNSVFRALALSIIPSMLFLFSGIMSRSVLLIIASVLFAPSHIVISYKNVK